MEVTIDKFGCILIPKQIRKLLNLQAGQILELLIDKKSNSLDLIPKETRAVEMSVTESGIPIFLFGSYDEADFDIVELIKESRDERDQKNLGL